LKALVYGVLIRGIVKVNLENVLLWNIFEPKEAK
jgi:hypothetical protein